jgi:hypothetical protein
VPVEVNREVAKEVYMCIHVVHIRYTVSVLIPLSYIDPHSSTYTHIRTVSGGGAAGINAFEVQFAVKPDDVRVASEVNCTSMKPVEEVTI